MNERREGMREVQNPGENADLSDLSISRLPSSPEVNPIKGAGRIVEAFENGTAVGQVVVPSDLRGTMSIDRESFALKLVGESALDRVSNLLRHVNRRPEECIGLHLSSSAEQILEGAFGHEPEAQEGLAAIKAVVSDARENGNIQAPTQSYRLAA